MRVSWGMAVGVLVFTACSHHEPTRVVDAGPDGGAPADAGPDAGPPDAGPPDAGPPDAGAPDAGWPGSWETLGPPLGHEAQVYPAIAASRWVWLRGLSEPSVTTNGDELSSPGK